MMLLAVVAGTASSHIVIHNNHHALP